MNQAMSDVAVCGSMLALGLLVVALTLIGKLVHRTGGIEHEEGRIWLELPKGDK